MKKRLIAGFLLCGAVLVFSSVDFSAAKDETYSYALPQTEGVYDVPGKPDMKLKVFVYKAKDGEIEKAVKGSKVQPTAPVESCIATATADPQAETMISAAGWKLPSAWTYNVNLASVPGTVGADRAVRLIDNSYASWQGVLGTSAIFNRGADTLKTAARYDGQNIVAWGKTNVTALAVTYTWYDNSTGMAVEIDTIMNSKFKWYWSDPATWAEGQTCAYEGVYDAQDILTHELGHTVGLNDEYTDPFVHSTMYGYGSVYETKKDTLTIGDISGAETVYGLGL